MKMSVQRMVSVRRDILIGIGLRLNLLLELDVTASQVAQQFANSWRDGFLSGEPLDDGGFTRVNGMDVFSLNSVVARPVVSDDELVVLKHGDGGVTC